MKEIYNGIVATLLTAFVYLVGGLDVAMIALLVAIVLDYVSGVAPTTIKDELAIYYLDPPLAEIPELQGMTLEEAGLSRAVVFPLVIQLKNSQGTAISDEVAAALAGTTTVDLSGATGDAQPAPAPAAEEEVLP